MVVTEHAMNQDEHRPLALVKIGNSIRSYLT